MLKLPSILRHPALCGLAILMSACAGPAPQQETSAAMNSAEKKAFTALMTVVYPVDDLQKGKDWYQQALGKPPYFDETFYVGFNVAGYELGLLPREGGSRRQEAGSTAYWGTEDIEATVKRLVGIGAAVEQAVEDVGDGIKVATLRDPFGNYLGIIENPHFPNTAE